MRSSFLFLVPLLCGLAACSASAADDEPENSPPGDYTYCGALTATCDPFYEGETTPCSRAASAQCTTFEAARSAPYRAAVVACAKEHSPCIKPFFECITATQEGVVPTAAHEATKTEYCAACPDTNGSTICSAFFATEAAGGALSGAGRFLLDYDDAVVVAATEECRSGLPPATACAPFDYLSCLQRAIRSRSAPQECGGK